MKLRNKKTGEIDDFLLEVMDDRIKLYRRVGNSETKNIWWYNSLAELNEDWEDYKPTEPLIKDEKIRKAVRAWWETIPDAVTDKRVLYKNNDDFVVGVYSIYCGAIQSETMEKCRFYTIDELCGEEEE